MTPQFTAMPGQSGPAQRLAESIGLDYTEISVHRFPDGESLVRIEATADCCIVYCSLDRPNAKLVELLLAASALRNQGTKRLILVAPYLCYMRQDKAFHPGEAISQQVVGRLLAGAFDRLITVDPHLHRVASLVEALPGIETTTLSAGALFAASVKADHPSGDIVLIGPDEESRQWVGQIAQDLGCDYLIARKARGGDRQVTIHIDGIETVKARQALLIDDIVASGRTLGVCAGLLLDAGSSAVEALATHCLCTDDDLKALQTAGVRRLRTTDSIQHPTNAFALAPVLAGALQPEVSV